VSLPAGRFVAKIGTLEMYYLSLPVDLIFMGYRPGSRIKMACLVVFVIVFFNPLCAYSQGPASGFYIIIKNKKNCPNRLSSHDGTKKYCLPKEPVITSSDFESISEVRYDSLLQLQYTQLTLTHAGLRSLRFLTQRLSDSQLALVIDDQVAGIFDNVDKNVGRTIPIRGGVNAPEVQWIYDRLKKEIP